MKIKKTYIPLLLTSALVLAGCHPFVKYPDSRVAPVLGKGAAFGGAFGLGAGAGAAVTGTAGGAGIGALAGTAIGAYQQSTVHWLKVLRKDGVQVIQTGQIVKIVIPSDKIFSFDTDSFIPHRVGILDHVTQFIQNYGPVNLTVNAYTDNVGSPEHSLKLSKAQAKSILSYLWSHGISSSRIRAIGHGQDSSIADNFDSIGSFWNRRIEIVFAYN